MALADTGRGRPSRRELAPSCGGCLRGRTSVSLAGFARLAGEGLRVVAGAAVSVAPGDLGAVEELGVSELTAEAALLQARLDLLQAQLARLGERGPGSGREG